MKQKLLNSFRLRVLLLAFSLIIEGTLFSDAWADSYQLVTNASQLSVGDIILITNAKDDGSAYALGPQNGNNCPAKSVTISSSAIADKGDAQEITLYSSSSSKFSFQVDTSSFLYAASSSKNYLKTSSKKAYWSIDINTTSYVATISDQSNTDNHNKMKYNSNNGSPLFSCYTSADNNLYVFRKVTAAPTQVATPTFSPTAGAVPYNSGITISCGTDGATIYYTTDNSLPTSSSTEYDPENKPVVTAAVTIKAIAIDKTGDLSDSQVASASYSVAAPTTPTFSPAEGSVVYGSSLTLTSDEGTTIYYTTNGDTPDNTKTAYNPTSKPTITAAGTIKAIAYDAGGNTSDVGSATYTLKAPAAPVFSLDAGMVTKGASLELSAEAGTTIRYTTDGSEPTASVGNVYSSAITINSTQSIKAVAYDGAGTCSSVVTKAYTVFVGDIVSFDATSDKGTNQSKNEVSFTTSATESSVFKFYKNSTSTFSTTNGKIKKIEFTGVSGYAISNMTASTGTLNTNDSPNGVWTGDVTSVTFTASSAQTRATIIKVYVARTAAPTFSISEDEYSCAQSVELSCATDGASIYYTTDGSTPTSSSTAYKGSISVTETQTIKAIAIYDGIESTVSSAEYTMIRPNAPTFDVADCVFDDAFDIQLSTETADATIYYTTDGSTPTTSSSVYSTNVAIPAATTTVKAIAVKDGLASDVSSVTYTYDSRTTPTFTLSSTAVGLKVNVLGEVTLTTNHDGTITVVGNDDDHFTVDYNTTTKKCEFSADYVGEYTITFTATGSATYKDANGSVTVTVTKKASTVVTTPVFTNKDMYSTPKSGSFTGVAQYNSSDIAGAAVTYSSSDETVATINETTGDVTFVGAGTTTLTASYAGNDEYEASEASYELTLIDTTPQETTIEVITNYSWLGVSNTGSLSIFPTNINCQGVTATISGSGTKTRGDDTYIRLYAGNTLKLSAPSGYYISRIVFNHKTGSNNVTVDNGNWNNSTHKWIGFTSDVTFTIGGSSGNNQINGFTITLAEIVTVGSAGYTTYVTKHNVSFDGVTAYIAKKVNAETITLEEIEEAPIGTPVVIAASEGTYALDAVDTNPTVSGNLLLASDGIVTGDGSSYWALSKFNGVVGFNVVGDGVTIPAGKAYLDLSDSDVKGFLSFDFGIADGIETMENNGQWTMDNAQIFNLAGQRVSKAKRGLYIVNSKKVLVK